MRIAYLHTLWYTHEPTMVLVHGSLSLALVHLIEVMFAATSIHSVPVSAITYSITLVSYTSDTSLHSSSDASLI